MFPFPAYVRDESVCQTAHLCVRASVCNSSHDSLFPSFKGGGGSLDYPELHEAARHQHRHTGVPRCSV